MKVKVEEVDDGYWFMTIGLTTNKIKMESVISEPYLDSYETWIKLASGEGNVRSNTLQLKERCYSLNCEYSGGGNDVSFDITIKRESLSGPLLEAIEDVKKRGFKFADK